MATKPINSPAEYVQTGNLKFRCRTPESIARAEKKMDALEAFFPKDRCRELIKLTLEKEQTELLAADAVLMPPLDPEEEAAALEEHVCVAANAIFTAWINILREACIESGDKPVRLDSSLLPPPELAQYDGVGWDQWLLNSPFYLTVEQIRELMALYAKNLIPAFNLMVANNPNGFELTENDFICKDKDGFYLPPMTKE